MFFFVELSSVSNVSINYVTFPVHFTGKFEGQSPDNSEQQQLVDAVYRDAIRTDSDHPYFANCRPPDSSYISQHYHPSEHSSITSGDDNIQKLINIIVIYTLEHDHVAYTQGMTDILAPILYVMKNEADAYIVFSAMVDRIRMNFEQWCSGTLLKLQRFRHLCAVLDPALYYTLTRNMEEDPFILFFGMVLIECRREFSFEDSFHLLETIWATEACIKNSFPESSDKSLAEWAKFMTFNSWEVLQQVFDGSGGNYSAEPLHHTMSISYSYQYSRNPSLLSYSPTQVLNPFVRMSIEQQRPRPSGPDPTQGLVTAEVHQQDSPPLRSPSVNSSITSSLSSLASESNQASLSHDAPLPAQDRKQQNLDDDQLTLVSQDRVDSRLRSLSDSNLHSISHSLSSQARSPMVRRSMSPQATPVDNLLVNQKLENSSFSHSESELYDTFNNSSKVVSERKASLPPKRSLSLRYRGKSTEMSDMSSVSSGTASATGLLSSFKSGEDVKVSPAPSGADGKGSTQPNSPVVQPSGSNTQLVPSDNVSAHSDLQCPLSPFSPDSGVANSEAMNQDDQCNGNASKFEESEATIKRKVVINGVLDSSHEPQVLSDHTPSRMQDIRPMYRPRHFSDNPDSFVEARQQCVKSVGRGGGVVEHGGMITTIGHSLKNSLLPNRKPGDSRSNTDTLLQPSRDIHRRQKKSLDKRKRKTSSSPKLVHGKMTPIDHSINPTPIQYDSDIPSSARVTPIAFFDTMEKLVPKSASSRSSPMRPLISERNIRFEDGRSQTGSTKGATRRDDDGTMEEADDQDDVFLRTSELEASIMSHLISVEQGAPRVTREASLSVPFSECYSLFICLSILVQRRDEIMQDSTDFYRLSEILNSQAGSQDLDSTLRVARKLFKTYRNYQEAFCRRNSNSVDCWLDDTG